MMPVEHNFPRNMVDTEFPIAFLSHTITDTQQKWSTTEQEAYGVYYAVTKWNYYLQGAEIIVWNDHKPLARFLNRKNANNKVNRWGLELAIYNITFEWISGAMQQSSWLSFMYLVELPQHRPGNHEHAIHNPPLMDPHLTPGVGLAQHSSPEDTTPQTDAIALRCH